MFKARSMRIKFLKEKKNFLTGLQAFRQFFALLARSYLETIGTDIYIFSNKPLQTIRLK